jgi:hypothetical protein
MTRERRKHPRRSKELNIHFVVDKTTQDVRGTGVSRDVSRGGMYFEPRHWRGGTSIKKGDKLKLRVSGVRRDARVVRIERGPEAGEQGLGIAVFFHGSPEMARTKELAG